MTVCCAEVLGLKAVSDEFPLPRARAGPDIVRVKVPPPDLRDEFTQMSAYVFKLISSNEPDCAATKDHTEQSHSWFRLCKSHISASWGCGLWSRADVHG